MQIGCATTAYSDHSVLQRRILELEAEKLELERTCEQLLDINVKHECKIQEQQLQINELQSQLQQSNTIFDYRNQIQNVLRLKFEQYSMEIQKCTIEDNISLIQSQFDLEKVKNSQLEQQNNSLQIENQTLIQKVNSIEEESTNYKQQLEQDLSECKQKNDELEQDLSQLLQQCDSLVTKNKSLEQEAANLRAQFMVKEQKKRKSSEMLSTSMISTPSKRGSEPTSTMKLFHSSSSLQSPLKKKPKTVSEEKLKKRYNTKVKRALQELTEEFDEEE